MAEDIQFRIEGALGRITLNRPGVLNALTGQMCEGVLAHLSEWGREAKVKAVAIDAVPGRAFCAGGDIRAIYEMARRGDKDEAMGFLAAEYRMNAAIAGFGKPYVALIDGIAMGGGAGISVHGSFRAAGGKTLLAMPETGIGFFTDVGASYFLPRCPGVIGMYLGLTGARLGAADCLYAGLATHYVAPERYGEIVPRLAAGENPQTVLEALAGDAGAAPLAAAREAIDRVFSAPDVDEIFARLEKEGAWGAGIAADLAGRSPTSLKIVQRQLREGAKRDLEACLAMELGIAARILEGHDFFEGVRAVLIDKDQAPKWRPGRLGDVAEAEIDRYFASEFGLSL